MKFWILAALIAIAFLYSHGRAEAIEVTDCNVRLPVGGHRVTVIVADGRTVQSCYVVQRIGVVS